MKIGLPIYKKLIIHFSRPSIALLRPLQISIELCEPVSGAAVIFKDFGKYTKFLSKESFLRHNKVEETWAINVSGAEYLRTWSICLHGMGSSLTAFQKLIELRVNDSGINLCSQIGAIAQKYGAVCGPIKPGAKGVRDLLRSIDNTTAINRITK